MLQKRRKLAKKAPPKEELPKEKEEAEDEPLIDSGGQEKVLHLYKKYYDECIAKYGPRTAVLMQVGDFYEMYNYENDDGSCWTNLKDVARAAVLEIANKAALKEMARPYQMAGAGVDHIGKFRDALLDHGYVIVFIDQLKQKCKNPPRKITQVLTPGTQIQELRDEGSCNLVVVNIENNAPRAAVARIDRIQLSIGLASVDLSTGETMVHSTCSVKDYETKALDDAYRFLQAQCAKEVHVICSGFKRLDESQLRNFKSYVSDHLELDRFFVRKFEIEWPSKKQSIEYQREILNKVYNSNRNADESPIQAVGLERLPHCSVALTAAFESVYECRPGALSGMLIPEVWSPGEHLVLEHNAIEQLSLTGGTSLFSIINHTETSMGRRQLERWILNPVGNQADVINERLDAVQAIIDTGDDEMARLRKALKDISADTIRLLRQAELQERQSQSALQPNKLANMYNAFTQMGQVFEWITTTNNPALTVWNPNQETVDGVNQWLESVRTNFDLDKLSSVSRISTTIVNPEDLRIFKPGVKPGVDLVFERIGSAAGDLDETGLMLAALLYRPDTPRARAWASSGQKNAQNKLDEKQEKFLRPKAKLTNNTSGAHYMVNNGDVDMLRWYCDQVRMSKSTSQIRWWKDSKDWAKNVKGVRDEVNSDEEEDDSNSFQAQLRQGAYSGAAAKAALDYLSVEQIQLINELRISNAKTKSKTRVNVDRSDEAWSLINNAAAVIREAVENAFCQFVAESVSTHHEALMDASTAIAEIDCLASNARTARLNCYHRPTIVNTSEGSFVQAKLLRHPIIERIHDDVEYVPNDITIGGEGLILFGVNNSGKTSLCKAVALNVIMAQAGCFVACDELKMRPFENIVTRLSGTDDMQTGRGTFAVEMSELRTILARASPRSLVLGDEICHGTEYPSAIGLVSASIIELAQRRTNFMFATHLHALGSIDDVTKLENVHFKYFHVERDEETGILTYDRTLRDGSGPATYGIEVAEAQGIPRRLIELAHRIRRYVVDEPQQLVSDARSHYNTKVIKDQCKMPGCTRAAVDTHHIKEQRTADENGMIDGRFHKNRKHNQVTLCKGHHNECTFGTLIIDGWVETASGGRKLVYHYYDDDGEEAKE